MPEKFGNHRAFIPGILQAYLEGFDYGDDSSVWFEKLRTIATSFNYAAKTGPYKKHPENYNGLHRRRVVLRPLRADGAAEHPRPARDYPCARRGGVHCPRPRVLRAHTGVIGFSAA